VVIPVSGSSSRKASSMLTVAGPASPRSIVLPQCNDLHATPHVAVVLVCSDGSEGCASTCFSCHVAFFVPLCVHRTLPPMSCPGVRCPRFVNLSSCASMCAVAQVLNRRFMLGFSGIFVTLGALRAII
jgi:hypothetical protein